MTRFSTREYTELFRVIAREAFIVRYMGLDVGEVRIGVAVSDETGLIARGLKTLQRVSWKRDLEALSNMIQENEVGHIVVGQPLNLDGSHGLQAGRVDNFVERLKGASRTNDQSASRW